MNTNMTLGSLFDGAGTCQLAAQQYGITTLWSSEIEKFCCEVTAKRFPNTKQLGDITKIDGSKIDPVDIISFGSPCQDLSVAGKREGLGGERSGLFMEAVRIIKEMREATNGKYPAIAIWENVPGAFSSNKGEDFRVVLEELCQVKDSNAVIPRPAKWNNAGLIVADGYSIAWRVLDAQFWGVPQRRRRIFLVADFGGQCAGQILFEREGLSRDFAESREAWKGTSSDAENRANYPVISFNGRQDPVSGTVTVALDASYPQAQCLAFGTKVWDARGNGNGLISPAITGDHNNRVTDYTGIVVKAVNQNADGEVRGSDVAYTLSTNSNPSGRNAPIICYPNKARTLTARYDSSPCIDRGQNVVVCATQKAYDKWQIDDIGTTIKATGGSYNGGSENIATTSNTVRRLTPTECARLQGIPDWWTSDVHHSDSAEYKMWGNGMALPCVMYVFEGVRNLLGSRWLDERSEINA